MDTLFADERLGHLTTVKEMATLGFQACWMRRAIDF
jgi:hypothetical protein